MSTNKTNTIRLFSKPRVVLLNQVDYCTDVCNMKLSSVGRLCLLGDDAWGRVSTGRLYVVCGVRTLDIGDGLIEDRLEGLGALELLLDLGDDGLGELALLPLLDLALVADPRVEDALGLVRDGGLLLKLVGLGLELGGLLRVVSGALRGGA